MGFTHLCQNAGGGLARRVVPLASGFNPTWVHFYWGTSGWGSLQIWVWLVRVSEWVQSICKALQVTASSQPWHPRAMKQLHNFTLQRFNFDSEPFPMWPENETVKKTTEQLLSKVSCFSPGKSRARPKHASSSSLSKYWSVCRDQLELDTFSLDATCCTALPLPRHVWQ